MQLPTLARLGHVSLATPDLDTSRWFFRDVLGLEEVGGQDGAILLKAWGDYGHHTLRLVPSQSNAYVEHIGWRAARPEVIDELPERLAAYGEVELVADGDIAGQGRTIRFHALDRFPFEIYYDIRPAAQGSASVRRSVVKTNAFAVLNRGISPRRLDHVNLTCTDHAQAVHWMADLLGFKMREYVHRDGQIEAAWMGVSALPHDLALGMDRYGKRAGFHHVAFSVDSGSDVLRATEYLAEHEIALERGPGRHAISQALYIYVRDPGSGHRVEIYTGGYVILDPDWEPVGWSTEEYRQWWGPELDYLKAEEFAETTDCGPAVVP